MKVATWTLKAKVTFVFDVRSIPSEDFGKKYEEHLNRIAKRILLPDLVF